MRPASYLFSAYLFDSNAEIPICYHSNIYNFLKLDITNQILHLSIFMVARNVQPRIPIF